MNTYNYNVINPFKYEQDMDNIHPVKLGRWNKISALTDVHSSENHKIGEINLMLGNSETSVIEYVVFHFENALGLGEKKYLIPWGKFNVQNTIDVFFTPGDISILRNAPSFHQNNWPDDTGLFMDEVDNYWKNY